MELSTKPDTILIPIREPSRLQTAIQKRQMKRPGLPFTEEEINTEERAVIKSAMTDVNQFSIAHINNKPFYKEININASDYDNVFMEVYAVALPCLLMFPYIEIGVIEDDTDFELTGNDKRQQLIFKLNNK